MTLLGHPALGSSWETLVIENITAAMPGWDAFFIGPQQALKSTWC